MKHFTLFILITCMAFLSEAQVWSVQVTAFPTPGAYARDISISDPNTVWMGSSASALSPQGYIQEFCKTTNGGTLWQGGIFTTDTAQYISNISAAGPDTCYILTTDAYTFTGGTIFKTTDGGLSWNKIGVNQIFTDPFSYGNVVHFWDAYNGIAIGDPENGNYAIFHTSDGGVNWTQLGPGNAPAQISGMELGMPGVYGVVGDFIYFGNTNGRVFCSKDRGNNWYSSTAGALNASEAIMSVAFTDTLHGFLQRLNSSGSAPYSFYQTSDGGNTWNQITPVGSVFNMDHKAIPGTHTLVSVGFGQAAGSSVSYDYGSTWSLLDSTGMGTTHGYVNVEFYDAVTGWAGNPNLTGNSGGVYRWSGNALTSLRSVDRSNELSCYPNPAQDFIRLDYNKTFKNGVRVNLYDVSGKMVLTENHNHWEPGLQVDLRNLTAGSYLVEIQSGETSLRKKIVKY